jgi:hypothetical protein
MTTNKLYQWEITILICVIFTYVFQSWCKLNPILIANKEFKGKKSNIHFNVQNTDIIKKYEWINWEQNFQASNPEYQDFCTNALKTLKGTSQYAQDMWLFQNIFKTDPLKKRMYVDSGTNDYRDISNTFFFDVCLGWEGICIEPHTKYHENILKHRSCKLVKKCLSDQPSEVGFLLSDASSAIDVNDENKIRCTDLKEILNGTSTIDLWSLDVEGHEINILKAINFSEIKVGVILVEDFWLPHDKLDELLLNGNMFKAAQFPIDAVYVNRDIIPSLPHTFWYPQEWTEYQRIISEYRIQMINQNKLQI